MMTAFFFFPNNKPTVQVLNSEEHEGSAAIVKMNAVLLIWKN